VSRRRGRPMKTYTQVSRELAAAAAREALRPVVEALVLEVLESHAAHHPGCPGGCPGLNAVSEAKKALGLFRHWALASRPG
jgi:hypothetical protein